MMREPEFAAIGAEGERYALPGEVAGLMFRMTERDDRFRPGGPSRFPRRSDGPEPGKRPTLRRAMLELGVTLAGIIVVMCAIVTVVRLAG